MSQLIRTLRKIRRNIWLCFALNDAATTATGDLSSVYWEILE